MEGVGSRLGRASSRYGPPAAAAVFSGPVRKWKKKWVHVSSNHHNNNNNNSHSQSNGHNNSNSSRLLLRRWTPLAAATSTAADASPEEPPKRRFRYTPIAVVEEQRKAAEKLEQEAKTGEANQFNAWKTIKKDELNSGEDLKKETQQSTVTHLDLGLYLEGGNSDHDSVSQSRDAQMKKANSGGLWTG